MKDRIKDTPNSMVATDTGSILWHHLTHPHSDNILPLLTPSCFIHIVYHHKHSSVGWNNQDVSHDDEDYFCSGNIDSLQAFLNTCMFQGLHLNLAWILCRGWSGRKTASWSWFWTSGRRTPVITVNSLNSEHCHEASTTPEHPEASTTPERKILQLWL